MEQFDLDTYVDNSTEAERQRAWEQHREEFEQESRNREFADAMSRGQGWSSYRGY